MFPIFRFFLGLTALLAVFFSSPAMADPSGRVGRISLLDGPSLFRADREDSGTQATLNWPVSTAAIVDTENGSRAEIWIGSTAFRLAGESRLEFGVVDDRQIHVNLAIGTLAMTIRDRDQADDLEVRTPHGLVKFGTAGSYRIDVGTLYTNVSTTSGNAYVSKGERPIGVGPGRTVSIDLNGAVASYGDSRRDSFDDWTASRDAATQSRVASQYISSEMTGYQDLEHYGEWSSVADYGSVWYPRAVPSGWAPYRDGRWAWIAPWGWTWVDAAPWGFAPFHYGRWLEVRGRWAWAPGAYVARPVYAPALVAWVGNPGWSVRFSAGSAPAVGWFPLAPREVYVPSYRASNNYVRQVNITHITNVTLVERAMAERGERHFAHRNSVRAVTVVPANTLRESRPIASANLPSRGQGELRQAPLSVQAPGSNWVAPSSSISRVRPSGPASPGRETNENPRPPARQNAVDSIAPRITNEPLRTIEPRGERPRNNTEAPRPDGWQRPLPPGVNRLPAESRSPEPVAIPKVSLPAGQPMQPTAPAVVAPALPPAERPRAEPREAINQPFGTSRLPAPPVSERPAERRSDRIASEPPTVAPPPQMRPSPPSIPAPPNLERPSAEPRPAPPPAERMPERRNERAPTVVNEPVPQMRPPGMASPPQMRPSPPPASISAPPNLERPSAEPRPAPPAERMPERRNERAPTVVNEPVPQMRAPAMAPPLPPAVSERPRHEPRQAPPEMRSPPPVMERRVERPVPVISEPPRPREMAPPVQQPRPPSPPAMPTPVREAPQMDRRPPAPEQRPANAPREDESRRQEKEKRPGAP